MLTKVTPLSTQLTLKDYLAQWKIKTDLLAAFAELGVEEPDDMSEIEPSEIEDIITSNGLKKVEARKLRKCYQAITNTDTSTANGSSGETKESSVLTASEKQKLLTYLETLKASNSTGNQEPMKFNQPMKLSFGTAKDALYFGEYLGIGPAYEAKIQSNGVEVMRQEIELLNQQGRRDGDPSWWFSNRNELMELWNYVVHEKCSEKEYPNGTRDKGRPPTNLEGFMKMPEFKTAGLEKKHVIALRLYTTAIYDYFNRPLRDKKLYRTYPDQPNKPRHPLAAMVCYLFIGIKRLRRVANIKPGEKVILWRGLKNVEDIPSKFMDGGGTEQAPMSTSLDMNVAMGYGTIDHRSMSRSVLLKVTAENDLEIGANVGWLSAFPQEAEVLYPPFAFLKPTIKEVVGDINIIQMTVNLSSDLGFSSVQSEDVGFSVGERIRVLLDGALCNGKIVDGLERLQFCGRRQHSYTTVSMN